jgi:hypothetical protein
MFLFHNSWHFTPPSIYPNLQLIFG